MIGKSMLVLATICAAVVLFAEVSNALEMPFSELEVYEGEEIYLECAVGNIGDNTVTWLKGGKQLTVGAKTVTKDSRVSVERPFRTTWNLNINNAKLSDQGVYTCRVNSTPAQSGSVKVTVVADK